ncbi:MAG: CHAD domain-containing protein [Gammaproteobacteria bacterium]|nr:CHAD domain-containing protein [Gammaproteobacteria bacterium]
MARSRDHEYHRPARDIHARALEACPRPPGEVAGRLDMVLQPEARADESMKVVLGRLRAAMAYNLPGMLANLDPEFLHDYRVAVRRTRSALTQVKGVFAAGITRRYREHFARLGALTSPARDADVYLLALDDYRTLLGPALGPALDAFADFLEAHRAREYGRLRAELSRPGQRRTMDAWGDFLARPVPRHPAAVNAARPVKELADERTWKMFRRVMKEGRAITATAPPEALHELRKSCKKLRYLMEFFASLYPAGETEPLIKALKRFQDNLGEYQDLSVQMDQLAGFEADMAREGHLAPATRQAMEALVVRLAARRGEVRDAFDERFAAFSEPAVQATFEALYHRGEG